MNNNYNRIWIASDLHLGHSLLVDKEKTRQRGFEEEFFKAWKDCVRQDDMVVLLGDIAFRQQSYWFTRIKESPGNVLLFLGNHDKNRTKWYEKFVTEVVSFGESRTFEHDWGNILFTHVPAFTAVATPYDERFLGLMRKHEKEFEGGSCILNIHGHTHGRGREKHNTFDCSLEVIGPRLVTLAQITELKFKK